MSTPPTGPTHGDHDADPTGMRDVLASLSDPAPMPHQLADRICASLAQEHQDRISATQWPTATGPAQHGAVVHDFAAEKDHRRPAQWIMAAAAVLAVGVIGTVVFDQLVNNEMDTSNVAAQANAATPADDASAPTGIASVGDAPFALGAQALLATAASDISGQDPSEALSLPESLDVRVGSVAPLDSTELDNCAQAAGESSEASWSGLTATINGEDVVVLGDTDPDSSTATQAWALDSSCPQNASATVLKGPVQLP